MTDGAVDWDKLRKLVLGWLEDCYCRVQEHQPRMTDDQTHAGFVASCCLLSTHEYMTTAFEAFKGSRVYPGLACCRPVAEMAITFWWCSQGPGPMKKNFERWGKKTLLEYEGWLKELATTQPFSDKFSRRELADVQSRFRKMLTGWKGVKCLPDIRTMLVNLDDQRGDGSAMSDLYPMLYKRLCAWAHGVFDPDRHFSLQGEIIERDPTPKAPADADWLALTSALHLVGGVHEAFGWEYDEVKQQYKSALSG